jgi:uncharacterized membrane protein
MAQSPETREPAGQTEGVAQTPLGVERRERRVIDQAGGEHAETSTRDYGAEQRLQLYKGVQLIWFIFGIVEVLIGLRVALKLFAANAANGFASFIYGAAGVFVAPFVGLTGTPAAGGSVLEVSSLVAMAIYALLAWGIVWVVRLLFLRSGSGSSTTYDRYQA